MRQAQNAIYDMDPMASILYNERPYSCSIDINHAREIAGPVIEKMLRLLEESGISANDALLIPDMLDRAITESNRFARAETVFKAYREEVFDPRGFCEMFAEAGNLNRPYDDRGNSLKSSP